jgi:hypothetical protein
MNTQDWYSEGLRPTRPAAYGEQLERLERYLKSIAEQHEAIGASVFWISQAKIASDLLINRGMVSWRLTRMAKRGSITRVMPGKSGTRGCGAVYRCNGPNEAKDAS